MKIYINDYRHHWLSPYTILEKVLFWKDWENIEYDTPWVDRWSTRLSPFCRALEKVLDVFHPKINYVKIDAWDTWSMDHTLGMIVLPMLKQLKERHHGSAQVDPEDVPEHLRPTELAGPDNGYTDNTVHERWDWVLDEMIFAFECKNNDNWDDQFWTGEWGDWKFEKTGDTAYNPFSGKTEQLSELKMGGNRTCDWEGRAAMQARISNGFRLFGKYYEGLWD
jgi:hypothetical protein